MNIFRFQSPWWLLALATLPMLIRHARQRRPAALLASSRRLFESMPISWAQRIGRMLPWLHYGGIALLIVALARPQAGREERRVHSEGIAIQMCIDKSGSMRAMDFTIDNQRTSRLDAVKRVFRDFVAGGEELKGRPDDQIGLVAFGGFAECVCPLTLDHATLLKLLETVKLPEPTADWAARGRYQQLLNEEMQTAIGDALVLACDRVKNAKAKSRIVILLSDGESNAGAVQPDEAAEVAKKLGIRVHCIGVGSLRGARMPILDSFGRLSLSGQIVRLDDRALRSIAAATDGKYWNAEDSRALAEIYSEIDKLEKSTIEGRTFVHYRELFPWPLSVGAAMLALEFVGRLTRWRRLP